MSPSVVLAQGAGRRAHVAAGAHGAGRPHGARGAHGAGRRAPNRGNRNPQPQLEPQIISFETCNINYLVLETPVCCISRVGVGGSYAIGELLM